MKPPQEMSEEELREAIEMMAFAEEDCRRRQKRLKEAVEIRRELEKELESRQKPT